MEKGILISCSAGNNRHDPLGSEATMKGVSLYKVRRNLLPNMMYHMVYTGSNSSRPDPGSLCLEGTLDPHVVGGKIVICDRGISPRIQKSQVVKEAGGIGMILSNTTANGEEHFKPIK
nr:subtilisin-like protease SBT1.3 [Tanacetum cinerariifolium]